MAKFKRYEGYVMHVPQQFIDSHLPVCPFCKSNDPHWLLCSKMEMSLAGGRTHYQCERCRGTLSSTSMDAAAEGGRQFRFNPGAAALNAASKGMKRQQVGVTYLRVESLGTVCTDATLLGRDEPVTFYQQLAGGAAPQVNRDIPEQPAQPAYQQPAQPSYQQPAQPSYQQQTYAPPVPQPSSPGGKKNGMLIVLILAACALGISFIANVADIRSTFGMFSMGGAFVLWSFIWLIQDLLFYASAALLLVFAIRYKSAKLPLLAGFSFIAIAAASAFGTLSLIVSIFYGGFSGMSFVWFLLDSGAVAVFLLAGLPLLKGGFNKILTIVAAGVYLFIGTLNLLTNSGGAAIVNALATVTLGVAFLFFALKYQPGNN